MSVAGSSSPVRETVQRLEDRVDVLEEENEELKDRVDNLEDENDNLHEESEELRQENQDLRDRVDELEKETQKNEDKLEYVGEKLEEKTSSEDEDPPHEIEKYARESTLKKELSENQKRAVDLWKELPRYAREVKDEFVLTPKELSRFLMDERDIPLEKAKKDRETQRRVKNYMKELAGEKRGLVRLIDRSQGWFSEKKQELANSHRVHIKKGAWKLIRKDRDVKKLLGTTEA